MGETRTDALRLDCDHRLKLEFHGTKVHLGLPGRMARRRREVNVSGSAQ